MDRALARRARGDQQWRALGPLENGTLLTARGSELETAHDVQRPFRRNGEFGFSQENVAHILVVARETRPQCRHRARGVRRDEFAVQLRRF